MKTVIVEKAVRDVDGILDALKKSDPPFAAVSVGADRRRTYIFLEDLESKDPSGLVMGWSDKPELRLTSTAPVGTLGIPEVVANDVDVHTLLIQKTTPGGDVLPGEDRIVLRTRHRVNISSMRVKLSEGMAMVKVGPSSAPGEAVVEVMDSEGVMTNASILLRFVSPKPTPHESASPKPEKKGGVLETLRKLIGI